MIFKKIIENISAGHAGPLYSEPEVSGHGGCSANPGGRTRWGTEAEKWASTSHSFHVWLDAPLPWLRCHFPHRGHRCRQWHSDRQCWRMQMALGLPSIDFTEQMWNSPPLFFWACKESKFTLNHISQQNMLVTTSSVELFCWAWKCSYYIQTWGPKPESSSLSIHSGWSHIPGKNRVKVDGCLKKIYIMVRDVSELDHHPLAEWVGTWPGGWRGWRAS